MAHHLIALLFSSAEYTTSPCMKPTRPVHHHHTPETLPSPLSLFCSAFISPFLTVTFFPFFFFPLCFQCRCPHFIPFYLCFCMYACLCVCLLLCTPSPLILPSLTSSVFSADVPLVSGGLAGRQQKWLWDWGMAVSCHWHTTQCWWAFNNTLPGQADRVREHRMQWGNNERRQQNFAGSW